MFIFFFFLYFTSFCLALDETKRREHLFSFLNTSLVATQETLDISHNCKRKRIKCRRLTWRSLLLRNRADNSTLRSNPVGTQKTHNNLQQPFHEVTARSATMHTTEYNVVHAIDANVATNSNTREIRRYCCSYFSRYEWTVVLWTPRTDAVTRLPKRTSAMTLMFVPDGYLHSRLWKKRREPRKRDVTLTIYTMWTLAADWQVTIASRRSPTRHAIPTHARTRLTHVHRICRVQVLCSSRTNFSRSRTKIPPLFLIVFAFWNNSPVQQPARHNDHRWLDHCATIWWIH